MEHKLIVSILQGRAANNIYTLPNGGVDVKKLCNEYYSLEKQP